MEKFNCFEVNTTMYFNLTCNLEPSPSGQNLLNLMSFDSKLIDEVWISIKAYYKKEDKFQQFLPDLEYDICGFLGDLGKNQSAFGLLLYRFLSNLEKNTENLIHPCPFSGNFGVRKYDAGELVANSMPNFLPLGLYKVVIRYFAKSTNVTYFRAVAYGEVTAVDEIRSYNVG